jgi:RNA polymerase sigma factor (sigma-70 family)
MTTSTMGTAIKRLRYTLQLHEDATQDALLLKRFIEHRDEAAFATIVRRHGPMVMGVCRRLLQDQHDAEDAFQVTFFVLIRKAASIAKRELLANWLYGVAHNTAIKARAINMKRRAREKQVAEMPDPMVGERTVACEGILAVLDQELSRLPEKYRVPIILCDLEGKTRRQAAALLACPEGSVSSRLARGRAMLAKRLNRQGVVAPAGGITAVLVQQAASASVPSGIFASTIKTSVLLAAGETAVSAISPKVATLMEGVMKVMLLSKLRIGVFCFLLSLLAFGTGLALFQKTMAQTQPTEQTKRGSQQLPRKSEKEPEEQPNDVLKKDADTLQAKWSIIFAVIEGTVVPTDILKAVVVEFKGDKMTQKPDIGVDATQPGKVKFNLYDKPGWTRFKLCGPNPKQIELTVMDPFEGEQKASVCNYQLKGDTLVVFDPKEGLEITSNDITPKGMRQNIMVLKRLPKMEGNASSKEKSSTPVPIKRSWDGIIQDRKLLKEVSDKKIVVENQAWSKLWKAWRTNEKLPTINFIREMVLVLTVTGPNKVSAPELVLGRFGNLKVAPPISTLLPDDGTIGYKIIVIDRAGVKSINGSPVEWPAGIENNPHIQEALQQYGKEEGREQRGPRFFFLAMLLNPAAHRQPPTISEEIALVVLGEPDFECELGTQEAGGKVVDRAVKYIYIVDNSKGQTIPKEWNVAATEKIQVSLVIRDGRVVSTGWNTYSGKADYPAYRKDKKP